MLGFNNFGSEVYTDFSLEYGTFPARLSRVCTSTSSKSSSDSLAYIRCGTKHSISLFPCCSNPCKMYSRVTGGESMSKKAWTHSRSLSITLAVEACSSRVTRGYFPGNFFTSEVQNASSFSHASRSSINSCILSHLHQLASKKNSTYPSQENPSILPSICRSRAAIGSKVE
jgi:hypothetical protein